MKKASTLLMLALSVVLLAGCAGSSSNTGSVQFAVSVSQGLASSIARVSVTSSAADIPSVTVDLAPTDGVWGGTIGNIPAGSNRFFLARAFDASGTPLFEGSSGVTISAHMTALVAITLQERGSPPPFENEAPLIDSLAASSTSVTPGGSISLVGSAHDPNPKDTVSFAWSATAGSFSSSSAASTSWTAPPSTGLQTVTLTVTDSRGLSSSIVLTVNVQTEGEAAGEARLSISFNKTPRVTCLGANPTQLAVGQTTSVSVTASDPDDDPLSYAWSATCAGTWVDATSRSARFTPTSLPAGACNNCRLTVSVSDGRGGHTAGTLALCVREPPPPSHFPPVIIRSYRSSDGATPGQVLTYEVVASDPQGSALTFSWEASTGTLGTPADSASRSRITWTAPACVSGSTPPAITATVTNAFNLTTTRSFTVTGLPACSGHWTLTGPMLGGPRQGHVASLLPDGRVLVAAGSAQKISFFLRTAELYDPATNTWSRTGSMVEARFAATATPLPNGKVLVAGGEGFGLLSATAELYDPVSGTWSPTGSMTEPREDHKAVLLSDGRVLVAGGVNLTGPLATAELYDPVSGTWSPTGSMTEPRESLTAARLLDGKVLVAGGTTAQLYDPASGTWSATGSPIGPINGPATLLPNGKVLVAGGTTAQLYDPASGTWSATGSPTEPIGGWAILLLDGRVLVLGFTTAQLYDPVSGTWSPTSPMIIPRAFYTATRLLDGRVLVAGTPNPEGDEESAEVYTPGPP